MRGLRGLLVLALLGACAQKKSAKMDYGHAGGWAGEAESGVSYGGAPAPMAVMEDESRSDRAPSRSRPPAPPPPPPPPGTVAMAPPMEPSPEPTPAPTEAAPAAARMVHYDGWARLRATDPEEVLDAAIGIAEEAGGRTERLSGTTVTLRVPVERFEELWEALLALGDVMDRSVRADDVTESFLAIELRVKTLEVTRDRLVQLLARAKDEREKLMLLEQITRVTEELDVVQSQLRTISDLAAMSRITLEVVPREAFSGSQDRPELAGFEWIRGLSPFRRAVWADDKRVALDVPDGLVALTPRGPFVAESADGTVLWTMRVANDPIGVAGFWADALEDRIAPEFENPERASLGAWDCLRLDEPGADEPYRWQVCVRDDGKWLSVAQAFFPGAAQVERYGAGVDAALKAGGES